MKIAIIGGGGIGSYLARTLYELIEKQQLSPKIHIEIFDDDSVEIDNILYQNFEPDDVLENKAEVLAEKYTLIANPIKVESFEQISHFDLVVCCVDNTATRRMLFENGFNDGAPDFIDLRSEGRSYAVFTKAGNTKKTLLASLPKEDKSGGSCQLQKDKDTQTFQQGNKVVAMIGSQLILDRTRNEVTSATMRQTL